MAKFKKENAKGTTDQLVFPRGVIAEFTLQSQSQGNMDSKPNDHQMVIIDDKEGMKNVMVSSHTKSRGCPDFKKWLEQVKSNKSGEAGEAQQSTKVSIVDLPFAEKRKDKEDYASSSDSGNDSENGSGNDSDNSNSNSNTNTNTSSNTEEEEDNIDYRGNQYSNDKLFYNSNSKDPTKKRNDPKSNPLEKTFSSIKVSKQDQASASNFKKETMTKHGQRRKARGIAQEDQELIRNVIEDKKEPAVIINSANFHPDKRRQSIPWTNTEVMYLKRGVERFGLSWAEILRFKDFKFNPCRTQVDLKDKWRNLTAYRPYGSHGKRLFIIVDENHQPIIRPDTKKPYRFHNRWPREAALKAASRSEFYKSESVTTIIYIREMENTSNSNGGGGDDEYSVRGSLIPPIVHVYQGTRERQVAPPHLFHLKVDSVWRADVRKIREERYVTQEDLYRIRGAITF